MNDYWNDPPESPEPPECCDEYMDIKEDGSCVCSICGNKIAPEPDVAPEPLIEIDYDGPPQPAKCPHGEEWHECNACMVASDFAYDAAREG